MQPVEMAIGYRANETKRVNRMLEKCNSDGLNSFDATFEKHKNGNKKWVNVAWRKPIFPLYDDRVYSDEIHEYWSDKPVRFADYNNCVHCFHRNVAFLRYMYTKHPEKIQWASNQEGNGKGYWKEECSYEKIINTNLQMRFDFESVCDDGFCEVG